MSNMGKFSKNRRQAALVERTLGLEALEQRQLLSAVGFENVEAPTALHGLTSGDLDANEDAIVVTIGGDYADDEDGETSLREALTAADYGSTIYFDSSLSSVDLNAELASMASNMDFTFASAEDGEPVTLEFYDYEASAVLQGIQFDGIALFVYNGSSLALVDCSFTGSYDAVLNPDEMDVDDVQGNVGFGTDGSFSAALVTNYGNMAFIGVTFEDVQLSISSEANRELPSWGNMDITCSLVSNYGNMALAGDMAQFDTAVGTAAPELSAGGFGIKADGNSLITSTSRIDNNSTFAIINNNENASLFVDGLISFSNTALAETERGDVSGNFATLLNNGGDVFVRDMITYDNSVAVDFDSRFNVEAEEGQVASIATVLRDVEVVNSTLLEGLAAYRADYYLYNTIFVSENTLERGFIISEDQNNLEITDAEQLAAMFPGYDAESGTFVDEQYTPWANAEIVNAGSNDYAGRNLLDAVGNERIYNETVDIGAIESNAYQLEIDEQMLHAEAAEGEAGLSTVIFTWDEIPGAVGYELRYFTAAEETDDIPEDAWTLVTGEELNDLEYILDGQAQRTWCAFQIKALGDNYNTLDSEWSYTEGAYTKKRLDAPDDFIAARRAPNTLNVMWALVPDASSYTLQYQKDGDTEWIDIPSEALELTNIGNSTLTDLEYDTLYHFRIKANSTDADYLDSDWVYTSRTTGSILQAVDLELEDRTVDSITVTWEDTVNNPSYVSNYEVQIFDTEADEWVDLTVTDGTATATELESDTSYDFRIRVVGKERDAVTSEWSYSSFATLCQLDAPDLAAEATGTTTILLTWDQVDNATGYSLTYTNDEGTEITRSFAADETEFEVTGLTPDTEYSFTIKAEGDEGTVSSEECEASAKTWIQLEAPALQVTERTTNSVTVAWDELEEPCDGYEVQYKLTEDGEWEDMELDGLTATFTEEYDIAPSQDIWFRIRALGVDGASATSEWSTTLESDTLEILVIERGAFEANGTSTSTISATWDAVEDAAGYELKYRAMGENEWQSENVTFGNDGVSAVISGLTDDTTYELQLVALGDGVNTVDSDPAYTQANTWIQLLPPDLELTDHTSSTLSVEWEAVDNASGYRLQYRAVNGNSWRNAVVDGTTSTVTGLQESTEYQFRIMAYGINGISADSAWSTNEFIYSTKGILKAPEDLSAAAKGLHVIDLLWAKVPNAETYEIHWRKVGDDAWNSCEMDQELSNTVNYTFTELDADTLYEFQVFALAGEDSEFEDSEGSNVAEARTLAVVKLDAPVLTLDSFEASTGAVLAWEAVENAADYTIFQSLDGGEFVVIGTTEDTTLETGVLEPNAQYVFYAIANSYCEEYETSDASNEVTLDTPKAELAKPVLDYTLGNQDIDVTWDPVRGAESYLLEYRDASSDEWSSVQLDADATSWTLENWTESTTYQFVLTAYGDDDTGPAVSDMLEVTTPIAVDFVSVVLTTPSEEGETVIPDAVPWVFEWDSVYLEIWTEDTAGLVAGREFQFTMDVDEMYDFVDEPEIATGFLLEQDDVTPNLYTIYVTEDFEPCDGDTFVARFALTPNTENGVSWEERVIGDAFQFNGDDLDTWVYAVPGDMNDDGTINMGYYELDTLEFDKEYGKTESYADFDGNGIVRTTDWYWMLENNQDKSFFGDRNIVYPEGFPYGIAPVEKLAPPSGSMEVKGLGIKDQVTDDAILALYDGPAGGSYVEYDVVEADPIPCVKDENALSGNGYENRFSNKQASQDESQNSIMNRIFAEFALADF